jgi:hypothetical protein
MPKTTTAYLEDGRHIEVPSGAVRDWQDDVRNGGTTDGLAVWYTEDEESAAEIQGSADDDTRCDHDERTHRIVNESQTGPGVVKDKPMRMVRVCHRRACILDAMAWVERGTGEPAAWAAPDLDYRFDVPKDIPAPEPATLAATAEPAASQGSRLTAIMAGHDRGPQYALVQCVGADFTCVNETSIEGSKGLSDEEITARLNERGWSVTPTLCPGHNLTTGQVPLPVAEMAP